MQVRIRPFEPTDKEIFLEMVKKFYAPPAVLHTVPEETLNLNFEAVFELPELVKGYIFEADGAPAGFALVSMKYETEVGGFAAWIEELFVDSSFRGCGIGGRFFEFIEKELKGKAKRLRLEVGEENAGAIKLYQRTGFEFLDYRQMVIDKEF